MLWHIVHNVDIVGGKRPLFARSPFLEAESIMPEEAREIFVGSASEENKDVIDNIFFNSVTYADNVSHVTVKLNYNDHGYNEFTAITNKM